MNGLVLGRFMPLHKGHCYLIDFALSMCSSLYVCICSRHDDPIAGNIRYKWIREQYPQALVHHITKEIPQANIQNPDAPKIWADEISMHIMADIQYFFASENYGWDFASHMGAKFIPLDFERNKVHISASVIRDAPLKHWKYLSVSVRRHVMMHIGVTGDIKLAQNLTDEFNVTLVQPYPSKKKIEQDVALSKKERAMVLKSEISAMHNFDCPFLVLYIEHSNQDEDSIEYLKDSVFKKVFVLASDEDLEHAKYYCNSLLESSWHELGL